MLADVEHAGLATARPAPGVLTALDEADTVIVAPSNPVAGLDPVLGLPGVREALRRKRSAVTAVSGVVSRYR